VGENGDPDRPTLPGLLADPATSFALKTVIKAWAGRDSLDAEHDARLLHEAFVGEVDQQLEVTP